MLGDVGYLGNDVVDLDDAESDTTTLSPRWLERVYTARERRLIDDAADTSRMHWRLWAAKEAAFKWARQVRPRTIFSPPKFEVMLGDDLESTGGRPDPLDTTIRMSLGGRVEWDGQRVSLVIEEGAGFVHAWVSERNHGVPTPRREVARLPESLLQDACGPSTFVRRRLLQDARRCLGNDSDIHDFEVVRDGRVPQLRSSRGLESASVSLSHHGRFVAFVWHPALIGHPASAKHPSVESGDCTAIPRNPHARSAARMNEVYA